MRCPNCLTEMTEADPDTVTVCPTCGARRGYGALGNFGAIHVLSRNGYREVRFWLILAGLLLFGSPFIVVMSATLIFIPGISFFNSIFYAVDFFLQSPPFLIVLLVSCYILGRSRGTQHWHGPEGYVGRVPPLVCGRPNGAAMAQCPYCGAHVQPFAVSCPQCRARRGFARFLARGRVFGLDAMIEDSFTIFLATALFPWIGASMNPLFWEYLSSGTLLDDRLGGFYLSTLVALSVLGLSLICLRLISVQRGPRWYPPYDPTRKTRLVPVPEGIDP